MADLKSVVTKLGYEDVSTLLNSGNLAFTAFGEEPGESAAKIESAIEAKLHVSCRVIGLSARELSSIMAGNPLLPMADNPSRLLVAVLGDSVDRRRLALLGKQDWSPEA